MDVERERRLGEALQAPAKYERRLSVLEPVSTLWRNDCEPGKHLKILRIRRIVPRYIIRLHRGHELQIEYVNICHLGPSCQV